MTYRMTPRGSRSAPKVNVVGILNRLDPFTSDGTPKDPDHSPAFRATMEFILGKPGDRCHSNIPLGSITISCSDVLYVNGASLGTGAELQVLLREWWDDRGLINEGAYAPRAFQYMLDDTIGYQDGARRIVIREFLR